MKEVCAEKVSHVQHYCWILYRLRPHQKENFLQVQTAVGGGYHAFSVCKTETYRIAKRLVLQKAGKIPGS